MDSRDTSLPAKIGDTQAGKRVWGPWATAGFGFLIIVVVFLSVILVAIIYTAVNVASVGTRSVAQIPASISDTEGLFVALSVIATAIVCVGLIIIIVRARRGATLVEYLGLRRISRKTILVWLSITLALVVLWDTITFVLGRPLNSESMVHQYNTSVWPALLWIAVVIFAPVFEETFFRGFLFEGFRQSRIGLAGTIGLVALLWSLLHIDYELYEIAAIFVSGIVLGIARFKTNSLWSPMLMHAFMNLIATFEVAINVNGLLS